MLIELSTENIAIMDRVDVRFGPGFTAITGETGAGKSLLIDAISLCLGERADSTLVRKGASSASVRAVFDAPQETRSLLVNLGYDIGEEALYLQRDLASEGRSICRINGRTAPLSVLKQVGDTLADLHGQHEHQSLLHASSHLRLLDDWIGADAHGAREAVVGAWGKLADLRGQAEELRRDASERERMLDVLRFQVDELESAGVRLGEIQELQTNLKRLQGAESLDTYLQAASACMFEADDSARNQLQSAISSIRDAAAIDLELQTALDSLISSELALESAIEETKSAISRVEFDPEKIEEIASRLDLYATLKRKYGTNEFELLEFLENAARDLDRLQNAEQLSSDLESQIAAAEADYETKAEGLSRLRKAGASLFANEVQSELRDLGMKAAAFESRLERREPAPNGVDAFEFLFSANAGEDVKPLARIASGGEMSRVMLAIKTVMAGKGGVPTLIFDEIDAGLGGQTAAVVAKKLARLGDVYQVLAITHVAQIAGKASAQVSIQKTSDNQRTVTIVRELSAEERVNEIARMVGGETVSDAAVANARQLLAD
jgi:DNA repair protein RecN (Recombination protein N)